MCSLKSSLTCTNTIGVPLQAHLTGVKLVPKTRAKDLHADAYHPFTQANYQFSPLVAEIANTFSNLVTIAIGLYGVFNLRSQGLPRRHLAGFAVLILFILCNSSSLLTNEIYRGLLSSGLAASLFMQRCATRLSF